MKCFATVLLKSLESGCGYKLSRLIVGRPVHATIGVEMRAPLSGRERAGISINDRRQRRRRID